MQLLPKLPRDQARPGQSGFPGVAVAAAVVVLASMLPVEGRPAEPAPLALLACAIEGRALLVAIERRTGRATAWPVADVPGGLVQGAGPPIEGSGVRSPFDPVIEPVQPGGGCADITSSRSGIIAANRSPEVVTRDRLDLARRLGSDG